MSVNHIKSYIVRNSYIFKFLVLLVLIAIYMSQITIVVAPSSNVECNIESIESKLTIEYIDLGVPNINSYFKSYMDYRTITNKNSRQYQMISKWAKVDDKGFLRIESEKDYNIQDDYYCIALGSYYGTSIGTKYRISLNTDRVFYGILTDCKADIHTNSSNQYGIKKDIVEFLVDLRTLNKPVKVMGSANVYMPLNGSVSKIERIDFIMK